MARSSPCESTDGRSPSPRPDSPYLPDMTLATVDPMAAVGGLADDCAIAHPHIHQPKGTVMRRTKIKVTVLSAVAVGLVVIALPAVANGVVGSGDRASGSAEIEGNSRRVIVEAHDAGNGIVNGRVSYRVYGVGTIEADVTCVDATGNTAIVAGTVTEATGAFSDRTDVKLRIIDNGPPGGTPDTIRLSTQLGTQCTDPGPGFDHPVENGNYAVQDRG